MDEASPGTNFGGGSRLFVRSQGGVLGNGDRRLYCAFDLGQLPADAAEILTAELRLIPEEASLLERTLSCHEITGAWTEAAITWNDQPAVDADHGTQLSSDDPQLWDATASVQAAFPGGEAGFRVKDENEGSADGPEQEYVSREGVGAEPELVVTFKREATSDLASTVTPNNNRVADLASEVTTRRASARFGQVATPTLEDAAGDPISPQSITYDAGRDAFWVVEFDGVVYRYDRVTLAHQFEDSISGNADSIAYDGTYLWIGDFNRIRKFSIADSSLTLEGSFDQDYSPFVLAWDGATLWGVEQDVALHKHDTDATLSIAESHTDFGHVRGMSFPEDDTTVVYFLEGEFEEDKFRKRRLSDWTQLAEWDYKGPEESGRENHNWGAVLVPNREVGSLYGVDESDQILVRHTGVDLETSLAIGKLLGEEDLAATVQPANIGAGADLPSQVKPNTGSEADLSSTVTAQPVEAADLAAAVQPANLGATADLTATIQPSTTPVAAQGRIEGSVAAPIVVDRQDFADISAEVGSALDWTHDGVTESLRRVVQLVDTQDAKTFPRERTSEHGRPSTQDRLRRGDAILYAKSGDGFQPGHRVAWNGHDWVVVGLLGWEMVGDVETYQEVGLRRLSIETTGRAQGRVQRTSHGDLLNEVTVNVV